MQTHVGTYVHLTHISCPPYDYDRKYLYRQKQEVIYYIENG